MTSSQLAHGLAALQALDDVMPGQGSPEIEEIYDDIRATLRVPVVNFVFRAAATEPPWLTCAWNAVRSVARTGGFEQEADDLRAEAATEPPPLDRRVVLALGDDLPKLQAYTATIHYVLPKLLLITTGWQAALEQATPTRPTARARDGDVPFGVAAGTADVPMVDPQRAGEPVRTTLREIADCHGHPAPATFYRGLANWPDLLTAVWAALHDVVQSAAFGEGRARIVASASRRAAVLGIPALVDCDSPRPDWQALLAVFRTRLLPDLMIVSSAVRAMLGSEDAARSPFSAAPR